jgi:hypothetical protein
MDPLLAQRIKVKCDTYLTGEELPCWCEPSMPYAGAKGKGGMFFLPPVGAEVVIEIHDDDDDLSELTVFWLNQCYNMTDKPSSKFLAKYGFMQGIDTPAGGLIFDSTTGAEKVTLDHPLGFKIEFSITGIVVSYLTNKIELTKTGMVNVKSTGKITLESPAGIELKTSGAVATSMVTIDGKLYNLHGHMGIGGLPPLTSPPPTGVIASGVTGGVNPA